jgi:hypothetical protein
MRTAVGVFQNAQDARAAVERLLSVTSRDRITLLSPTRDGRSTREKIENVPVTEDMKPFGAPMGAALGGALGLGFGVLLFLPGVGQITALGILASALLGAGGAVALGTAGKLADEGLSGGIPADELYVYEDALRKGRSVVIALVEDSGGDAAASRILEEAGAESLDAARENWWVGLRDAERLEYENKGWDFAQEEALFRKGFGAALDTRFRGKPHADVAADLRRLYPDDYAEEPFRRGYERGQAYRERLLAEHGA